MSTTQNAITVTINNPSKWQIDAIENLLAGTHVAQEDTPYAVNKKAAKPAKTVSPDEDEEFGTSPLKEEDLEEEDTLTFDKVLDVVNEYGSSYPKEMKAILAGFGLKSTKELKTAKNKWAAVFKKVSAKLG